jgi:tetratricopeptide (TPR) repeat protein
LSKDDDALADSAQALRVTPSWIDLRILRANIFMGRGKRDLVASEADTLVRENPKSEYAWVGAGKTYAALGRRDEALRAFDQALAIKPYAYIYLNREQVRPIGDLKNRMADLNEGLKVEPDNSDVLAEKARLLARTGDYKGALSSLDRVKADTSDRYYMLQRALVLHQAGRTAEAQRLFADVRAKSSTATELNNLCWAKATAGVMLESAVQDCHDAMTLSPDNAAYLDSLGMVLLKLGRVDEALTVYNQALAKRRDAPTSLMGRAIVYTRKGDAAHAGTDAAAARQLYPEIDDLFSEYGLKL